MATLTQLQNVNTRPFGLETINPSISPLFAEWTSNETDISADFKYIVRVYDEDGEVNEVETIARSSTLMGRYSPIHNLNSLIYNVFQPTITDITSCPDQTKMYNMKITPYNYLVEVSGETATTPDFILTKATFPITKVNSKLTGDLFNPVLVKTLSSSSYFTNKAYFGTFPNTISLDWDSVTLTIYMTLSDTVRTESIIHIMNNYALKDYTAGLINADEAVLEIPIGPQNILDSTEWQFITRTTYTVGMDEPVVETYNSGMTSFLEYFPREFQTGDYYTYQTMNDEIKQMVLSPLYRINIKDCASRYTPMDIIYLNTYGGYDTLTCYLKNEKVVSVEQKTYQKFPYEQTASSYLKSTTTRETTVYSDTINDIWNMNTNWLTSEEISALEDLWSSPDVYITIDGDNIAATIANTAQVIFNEKSPKLKRYQFSVIIADKKHRI